MTRQTSRVELGRAGFRSDRVGAIARGADVSHNPVVVVRDLPAGFFAVGRVRESGSVTILDSKEKLSAELARG